MTGPTPSGATTTGPATAGPAPLPTSRPYLGHALASEWTKMTSVRSTVWTLGSLVVVVVGIGLLVITQTDDGAFREIAYTSPALFGLLVGQIAVIVLGVLTITSEHATGLVRTTFTAAPERHRVLTAKYVVFSLTALVATTGSVGLVGTAAAIVHGGPGAGPHGVSEWFGALAGSLYVTLLGVLALAVGALLRHSAGAIAVMLGLVTLPPVIGAMLISWRETMPIGETIITYNAPVAMMQLFGMPGGSETGAAPSDFSHLLLILLVTGGAVAASYATVGRRDV
ncbi:ABC transporter permease [Streptomyces sp. NBC_01408]|uniref:ABC transporter permease n=1 Tax=Streptomyces sp. NBC_01408 TaxID=2903855 RepID=UPI002258D909|nr:ABC transporter permease [Streptomyces sp. NBC_01408]MCX4690964.1 ABC transporter permease [Streptomyces sp. NBC_01408]